MAAVSFDLERARGSADRLRAKRLELSALAIPPGRGWEPLQQATADLLRERPTGIGEVITKLMGMQSILDELPPSQANNRVAAFNTLYLRITRRIEDALRSGAAGPDFLEMLDVEFARRYFDALNLWNQDDDATPDVWEVLFKRARDERMSSLVAAMLGVNAHINHDLSLALIATWNELGAPADDLIHPDYLLVNEIFYEEIPPLRQSFSTEWQLAIDGFVGPLDDWSQRVLVTVTRAHAWEQARRLWRLRHDPDDFEAARLTMDRAASLVGEWLIFSDRLVNGTGAVAADGWQFFQRLSGRRRRAGRANGIRASAPRQSEAEPGQADEI
jgi:hypothetical protein